MKLHNLLFVFIFLFSSYLNDIQAREIPLPTADSINAIEVIDSIYFEDSLVLIPASFCDTDPFGTIGVVDPNAVSYQWFVEIPPLSGIWVLIAGETNPTYDAPFSAVTEYYRVEITYASGPPIPFPYEVTFYPAPIVDTPAIDIPQCNDNTFDLTSNTPLILGAQGADFEVRYFETLLDSQDNTNPIPNPVVYPIDILQVPTQIIYARIHNIFNTNCYENDNFEIDYRTVSIGLVTDLPVCDNVPIGIEPVDLTVKDIEALNGQDPIDYTVSYHGSQIDADTNANPHGNPYNATAPLETIYVRVENNANTDCYTTTTFDVVITTIPIPVAPTPLEECDIMELPDVPVNNGLTIFDLTTKDLEIIDINVDVSVRYFEDPVDANNGVNEIPNPTQFVNTIPGSQNIFARLESIFNTDCFRVTPLRLIVNPIPDGPGLLNRYSIELCDDNDPPGEGLEIFDLTQYETDILIGGQTWDLTYHISPEGADLGALDPDIILVPSIYTNTALTETIYIRVSIDITNPDTCYVIIELNLILNLLPETDFDIEDYILCEVDSDGIAFFDLTSKILEILNGQNPFIHEVTFYESQGWADNMINEIDPANSYENLFTPQTIYVGILNTLTGCYSSLQSFIIDVREGATVNRPKEAYTVCDQEPFDGIEEFDLTDPILINEILGAQVGGPYMVEFYISPEDAMEQNNPLQSPYENVINPQLVFVIVTNTDTGCTSEIISVILKVEHPPIVNLEDSYRLCVDENGLPIPEEDGELSPPRIDTFLNPIIYSFVWELNGLILGTETGPFIIANQEGVYTVTVTEISTTCSTTVSTTVFLSSPPLIYDAVVTSDAFADIHTIIATVAEGIGEYEFQLDDGPFQDDGNFIDINAGNHVVTIRDKFGCGSVTIELGVIDYPRFVTPNQDGYHDSWNILGISIGDPTAKIYIFDRFGKLLTQLSPTEGGWDGTYNGNPLPSSDYWFRIIYTERDQAGNDVQKEFRGHFSLKR